MSKAIRIRTKPGGDDKYVSVNLEQDFDELKVLSLTIDQREAYRSFESNYGAVAGRVDINNGFGLKNAKVSIFIPLDEIDKEDEVKRAIYPFESIKDKNSNGVRYNILPKLKQSKNHTPVGTFPSKREILDNSTMLEIYDKYYKFTTTTNEAGDFIFFGVPVGEQQIFIDIDVSDIGFLSVRPYDLISKGIPKEKFENKYKFKSSNSLKELPQIINASDTINVLPFWADDLEGGKRVGITRFDYSVTEYELTPTAMFMGSMFSDGNALSKNCRPRKKMGRMDDLETSNGTIEAITRTADGDIVKVNNIDENAIDENGNWAIQLPMNIRKVVTDEFGALVPSPNSDNGVASEADYRFRITYGDGDNSKRKRTRAKMLVPNMTNNYEFDEFSAKKLKDQQEKGLPVFKINEQLSYFSEEKDPTNQYNYLEDFFTFRWKKIYTVRQYIPRYQPNRNEKEGQQNFIGIKRISESSGVNKIPYNRLYTKNDFLYSLLCFILTVVGFFVAFVNSILQFINWLISEICEIRVPHICLGAGFENAGGRTLSPTWGELPDYQVWVYRDGVWKWGSVEKGSPKYANHVLGASKDSDQMSRNEAKIIGNYYKETTWTKGWSGFWTLFTGGKKKGGDGDESVERQKQQNWIHDSGTGSVIQQEETDEDIDSNDCGRPSDWVSEQLGEENGWAICWTFRGEIPSKRRIRNCIGYSMYFSGKTSNVNISQGPWVPDKTKTFINEDNEEVNIPIVVGGRRWWRASVSNNELVPTPPKEYEDNREKWSYKNVWYSSSQCMGLDTGTAGYPDSYYAGCVRTNIGLFNYKFVNRKWWARDYIVKKCNKPECEDGIRILGICISFAPRRIRRSPLKGLCNKCTNDAEVDPTAGNDGKGPDGDGVGYGVNKNCCNGCEDCEDNGVLGYYKNNPDDNDKQVMLSPKNCLGGNCCEKIAPITLRCRERGLETQPVRFSTGNCGINDKIARCKTCSGVFWTGISNWVECSLENYATKAGMLDFEFYNDWMNGSLYFPLINRKLKVKRGKTGKRGRGEVKKDVFCDYDCDGSNNTPDYQRPDKKTIYKVKLVGGGKISNYEFSGCKTTLPRRMGVTSDTVFDALREMKFVGVETKDGESPCSFTMYDVLGGAEPKNGDKVPNTDKKFKIREVEVAGPHGKPKYIKTEIDTDGDGKLDAEIWKNIGGHGHHKNKCKKNYLIERKEYIKTDFSDCVTKNNTRSEDSPEDEDVLKSYQEDDDGNAVSQEEYTSELFYIGPNQTKVIKHGLGTNNLNVKFKREQGGTVEDITHWSTPTYEIKTPNKIEVSWDPTNSDTIHLQVVVTSEDSKCTLNCSTQGTAACSRKLDCGCDNEEEKYNNTPVYRGLIKEYEDEIYYASLFQQYGVKFKPIDSKNYKKNMLFPTNITELGSSVTCDIDEAPFILRDLETTTYQVSEEDLIATSGKGTQEKPYKLIERDEALLNLSAYVDFGCTGIRCMNVRGSLVASQIGSELSDLNDTGLECNTCSIYNDVDTEIRSYFCRRFSTFTPSLSSNGKQITDMKVNYMRPGSTFGENYYEPYGDVSPKCNSDLDNKVATFSDATDVPDSDKFTVDNDLNDGDDLTPGDKCGYRGNGRRYKIIKIC